jgi:putative membrane protein
MSLLITWIANSLAIYGVAYIMGGVHVASLVDAFLAGGVLSLVNLIVKPIVFILTLPFTIVTLGLFYFVVTAFCLWLASVFVPGFTLQGPLTTIVASILISLLSTLINRTLTKASAEPPGR